MSATTDPADSPSPAPIEPLHNPSQAAHIPGVGVKALLAKKMPNSLNPAFKSPTDNLMTPVTKRLSDARKRHFVPVRDPILTGKLFEEDGDGDETRPTTTMAAPKEPLAKDDENPF